jgi:hypothetical protein
MTTAGARLRHVSLAERPFAPSRDLARRDSTTTRFPATGRRG